jgi:hypothetical protein
VRRKASSEAGRRQETRESGGASGAVDEGLGVHGEPTTGVGVEGRASIVCR